MKFLLPFRSAVQVLSPEAKSLVGSHKSRLGLAHCWGWLRFSEEPQPNSPSTVRRRSVYSPEPWPTSGFTVGLHARDIIPFPLLQYHPPPFFWFSCIKSFFLSCPLSFEALLTHILTAFPQVNVLFNVLFLHVFQYYLLTSRSLCCPSRLSKLYFICRYNKHMWQSFTAKWQVR